MLRKIKEFSLPEVEKKVLKFWAENRIFEKSVNRRKGKKKFVFYEGPPTANGQPGIHHVLSRSFKDIILRYKTMAGFFVPRRGGWDTHGLPVEIEVEKELGLKSKKDIEKYGIAEFNRKCRESVWRYKDEWERLTERIGFWLDMDNPYITYENSYIEALWGILKKVWDKKLLYKSHKVVPWCNRCGTALSSHEMAQGYAEVEDVSVYVKFKIKGPKFKSSYIISWTTTPWTLPGNVALAVNPNIIYAVVQYKEVQPPKINRNVRRTNLPNIERFILAKNRLSIIEKPHEIVKEIKGKELIGLSYEPLFNIKSLQNKNSHKVYAADFVNTDEGTGVVHTAVMYGEDDYSLGKKVGLPQCHTVDEGGRFTEEVSGLAGLYVKSKEAEEKIIKHLKAHNLLFKTEIYTHDYPFCWRCGMPLLYYARDSWFIAMSKLRAKLLAANKKINWIPEHIKNGRFGEWLTDVKDWALSRERYWATPLPVWECEKCHKIEVLGGADELNIKSGKSRNNYWALRHGESETQIKQVIDSGQKKYHLTTIGQDQVRRSVEKIKQKLSRSGQKIDFIFSSDITRTKESAQIAASILGVKKIIFDKRLREIYLADFSGCHPEEYHQAFPAYELKFQNKPKGGESLRDVRARVWNLLQELEKKYQKKNILLVSHEYPIWMLSHVAFGWSEKQAIAEKEKRDKAGDRAGYGEFVGVGELIPLDFKILPRDETGLMDLHRPYIDEFYFSCVKPRCGGKMKRVKEVIDAWFDSGAMPFAQDHRSAVRGGGNPAAIGFPADYIAEGIDQTRGWFYTLLAVSVLLGRSNPYKNVISLGLVLDKNGQKMSKSKGNVVSSWEMVEKYGSDIIRWYFYTINSPGEFKRFDETDIKKSVRQFISLLYNSFVFLNTYDAGVKKIPKFSPTTARSNVLDRWIVARLHQIIGAVTKNLDRYEVGGAAREIEKFINDLSRWYIRRSRRRFQKPDLARGPKDYKAALAVLNYVLLEISKLLAPFTPFFAEALYKSLVISHKSSVHLKDWPKADKKLIDKKLLDEMETVRTISSLAFAKRAEFGIKVRQPLRELRVKNKEPRNKALLEVLQDEVNVKKIVFDSKLKEEIWLDTEITHKLKEEGWFRELVRLTQGLRQDAGLEPKNIIIFVAELPEELRFVLGKNKKLFKKEVNAKSIEYGRSEKFDAELETKLDEWPVWIALRKS